MTSPTLNLFDFFLYGDVLLLPLLPPCFCSSVPSSTVPRSTVTFFGLDAVVGPQVRYRIVQLQNFLLCVITNLDSRHL